MKYVSYLMMSLIALSACCQTSMADVESGLPAETVVPALKVHAVTGEVMQEEVLDYVAKREDKPTIYFFVPAEKWSRPTARLLRQLDEKVTSEVQDAYIVAVWLTEDMAASKEYVPRAQQSLKLQHTGFTVYDGDKFGPGEWGINTDGDCTVVLTHKKKAIASHGYVSPNDTLVDEILKEFVAGVKKNE